MRKKSYSGFTIKICGNAHAYCSICRPDLYINGKSTECKRKIGIKSKISRRNEYENYIKKWLSGEIVCSYVNKRIRRWIIEKKGELCWQCGWCTKNIYSNTIMLEVDHIDGNNTNNI